jgi:hypothetical protein
VYRWLAATKDVVHFVDHRAARVKRNARLEGNDVTAGLVVHGNTVLPRPHVGTRRAARDERHETSVTPK